MFTRIGAAWAALGTEANRISYDLRRFGASPPPRYHDPAASPPARYRDAPSPRYHAAAASPPPRYRAPTHNAGGRYRGGAAAPGDAHSTGGGFPNAHTTGGGPSAQPGHANTTGGGFSHTQTHTTGGGLPPSHSTGGGYSPGSDFGSGSTPDAHRDGYRDTSFLHTPPSGIPPSSSYENLFRNPSGLPASNFYDRDTPPSGIPPSPNFYDHSAGRTTSTPPSGIPSSKSNFYDHSSTGTASHFSPPYSTTGVNTNGVKGHVPPHHGAAGVNHCSVNRPGYRWARGGSHGSDADSPEWEP